MGLVPAGLVYRISRGELIPDSPLLSFLIPAAVLLWLLFPIVLLSSGSAGSPWMVFRPQVLGFMLRRPLATLAFYLSSGLLFAVCLFLGWRAFAGTGLFWLVAPPVAAATLFIYARQLGRLAWQFDRTGFRGRRTRPAPKGTAVEAPRPKKRKKSEVPQTTDPWAVSEQGRPKKKRRSVTPQSDKLEAYGLAKDDAPPPPPKPAAAESPWDQEPLGIQEEPELSASKSEVWKADLPKPTALDMKLAAGPELPPPPRIPLVSGVYTFPWYPDNVVVWVALSIMGVVFCGWLQLVISLAPTG